MLTTVKAPWEGKINGFTLLFEAFALTLLREMTVNAAARILGEHDTRLWRLLKGYVQEAYQEADFSELKTVGCDELSARKPSAKPLMKCAVESTKACCAKEINH